MPHIGPVELLIVLVVILLLFGATRLPQLARGIGRSIHEFKKGASAEAEAAQAPATPKDQAVEKARSS